MLAAIWRDEAGLTSVEYAILLGLLFVAWTLSWSIFGEKVRASMSHSSTAFASVLRGPVG